MLNCNRDTKLKDILDDQEAFAIFQKHVGKEMTEGPIVFMMREKTLGSILDMIPVPELKKTFYRAMAEINGEEYTEEAEEFALSHKERITLPKLKKVKNLFGPELVFSEGSGVKIIKKNGKAFKDLAKDGVLYPYEDWRLPAMERARDLAGRLSIEEIAGLMLHSQQQNVPAGNHSILGTARYEGGEKAADIPDSALSDEQLNMMQKEGVRHMLVAGISSARTGAEWCNRVQAFSERQPWGIPVAISSDPRHGIDSSKEFNAGSGGSMSRWPEMIGMAAAFDPDAMRHFGEIASSEYRAVGITTALSPQIDLSTEPRWIRFGDCFSESSALSKDYAKAYCEGFQTSRGKARREEGWGMESVNAMVKHWPGGAACEAGRDAHFGCGKYAVYPGGNFEEHLKPFTEGAFALEGGTDKVAAVMPYYSVSYRIDADGLENVGNSYSRYMIQKLLREKYGYDGLVCTDWAITMDAFGPGEITSGKCWGAEELSVAERCLKILMAGVDQFGGMSDSEPVLAAYRMGCEQYGKDVMDERFRVSARRILTNMFRIGLFENPYADPDTAEKTVGNPEYIAAGEKAQEKSIVMLKNRAGTLPLKKHAKVYIPQLKSVAHPLWDGTMVPESCEKPVADALTAEYFTPAAVPEEADVAIVFLRIPGAVSANPSRGYSKKDLEEGGNGYIPISLQYRPYTAVMAREHSIAVDPADGLDRSYKGKTVRVDNECDLDSFLETKKRMGNKPVIAVLIAPSPMVVNEFEKDADAILLASGIMPKALFKLLSGEAEPSALLPMQLPKNMDAVETQLEDVPFDMECHTDSEGNRYDFGFGMNWKGVIRDERTTRYSVHSKSV